MQTLRAIVPAFTVAAVVSSAALANADGAAPPLAPAAAPSLAAPPLAPAPAPPLAPAPAPPRVHGPDEPFAHDESPYLLRLDVDIAALAAGGVLWVGTSFIGN